MEKIVELKGIVKNYGQGDVLVQALCNLDLQIRTGDFTAMAGPSGSGKSTLLNIIGGLDKPTEGEVRVEGQLLNDLSRTKLSQLRRDRIGFIFQGYNLIPVLTALENAEYILMLQGVPPRQRREKVMGVLQEVGLDGLQNRFPRELSGGQQQRVAIARAIASEPALVLADEPTANVDSKTAAGLLDLMGMLNEEKNTTFFFSTHDQEVMKQARHLLLLHDGRITFDGIPEDGLAEE